jgi:hypothetical protein
VVVVGGVVVGVVTPLIKLGNISATDDQTWLDMIRHDQKLDQAWSDVIRHDQTWSDMIRLEISPADLAGRLARQTCPADLPGRLARQTCPADLPGWLARQTFPAVLPGSLAMTG